MGSVYLGDLTKLCYYHPDHAADFVGIGMAKSKGVKMNRLELIQWRLPNYAPSVAKDIKAYLDKERQPINSIRREGTESQVRLDEQAGIRLSHT